MLKYMLWQGNLLQWPHRLLNLPQEQHWVVLQVMHTSNAIYHAVMRVGTFVVAGSIQLFLHGDTKRFNFFVILIGHRYPGRMRPGTGLDICEVAADVKVHELQLTKQCHALGSAQAGKDQGVAG